LKKLELKMILQNQRITGNLYSKIRNRCMKKISCSVFLMLTMAAMNCFAQTNDDLQKKYTVVNRVISHGADAGSIHLNNKDGAGIAWVNHTEFNTGTIEVDIKGKDVLQASFVGIAFHGLNDSNYETVYFRPFNFRATDSLRKIHAVQYMASPAFEWPILREKFPGKYEKGISPAPNPNAWFHARIVVGDKTIRVYVNGNEKPSLVIEPLVKTGGKMIGLWAGGTDGDWKNLRISPSAE